MRLERKHEPLLPRREFVKRVLRNVLLAGLLVLGSLGVGTLGYRTFAGLSWIDALYNAAMILTGMGPVAPLSTAGAKVFATVYALFSGVVFLTAAAVVVGPVAHRFLHRFHGAEDEEPTPRERPGRGRGRP